MSIIDKIISINGVLKEIFDFIQTDSVVKPDFEEYLATIGAKNITSSQIEKIFLPYIFERRIDGVSILEMFKETTKNKELAEGLITAQSSIYEHRDRKPLHTLESARG